MPHGILTAAGACFGMETNDTTTEGPLSNNLYDRLIENDVDNFRQKLSDKWHSYRQSLISDNALTDRINEAHQFLVDNGIYEKEEGAWDYEYSTADLDYLFNWLGKRLEFLDDYFGNITSTNNILNDNVFVLYPNPAQEKITLKGSFTHSTTFTVYNSLGEKIMEKPTNKDETEIDLQNLSAGMYVLEVDGERRIFYRQ